MTLMELAGNAQPDYAHRIVLARVDGKLMELTHKADISSDSKVEWVTAGETSGMQTYRRSVTLLMLKAVRDVYGTGVRVCVEYSLSKGYYCSVSGEVTVDADFIAKISDRMEELVDKKLPINKYTVGLDEAIRIFHEDGMEDIVGHQE